MPNSSRAAEHSPPRKLSFKRQLPWRLDVYNQICMPVAGRNSRAGIHFPNCHIIFYGIPATGIQMRQSPHHPFQQKADNHKSSWFDVFWVNKWVCITLHASTHSGSRSLKSSIVNRRNEQYIEWSSATEEIMITGGLNDDIVMSRHSMGGLECTLEGSLARLHQPASRNARASHPPQGKCKSQSSYLHTSTQDRFLGCGPI